MNTQLKRTGLIAGGAVVLLIVIWWMALMAPEGHKLSAAHKAHATANQQASKLQGQVSQLQALVQQIPGDKIALANLKNAVPDNPALDLALNQLQDAANQAGVTISTIGPSTPVATTGAASASTASGSSAHPSGSTSSASSSANTTTPSATPTIAVAISATGSYQELMAFITNLTKLQRTFVVSGLTMAGTGSKLSAQISANIYYAGQPTP